MFDITHHNVTEIFGFYNTVQIAFYQRIQDEGLSVRQTERLAQAADTRPVMVRRKVPFAGRTGTGVAR